MLYKLELQEKVKLKNQILGHLWLIIHNQGINISTFLFSTAIIKWQENDDGKKNKINFFFSNRQKFLIIILNWLNFNLISFYIYLLFKNLWVSFFYLK
jgi:hypothetical protein